MTIELNWFWILLTLIVFVTLFLAHNLGGLKIFSKHDNDLTKQFLDKFPLVSPDFYKKSQKEQIAENNQEIHEVNKRLDKNDLEHKKIWQAIEMLTELTKGDENNG